MEQKTNRRQFIKQGFQLCAGCAMLACSTKLSADDEEIDLEKLTYCGHQCAGCDALKATMENDLELKKSVHKRWKWKERLDVDFDPDVVFCWGCKPPEGKPINKFQEKCSVRVCAVDKGVQNCVVCDELIDCEKELWDRFPGQKQLCVDMQKKLKIRKKS